MFVVRTYGPVWVADWWIAGFVLGLMLCGDFAVLQASTYDGLAFDPRALSDGKATVAPQPTKASQRTTAPLMAALTPVP
jgi:hypothetical protein